jgi:TRAP-type C4-dicarboxylate transport system substrate-binding protein
MKNLSVRMGAALAAILIVAGCGSASGSSGSSQTGAAGTQTGAAGAQGSASDANYTAVTLRLQSEIPAGGELGPYLQQWVNAVKSASGGKINITIYPQGALYASTTVVPAVAAGEMDMTFVDVYSAAATVPALLALSLPMPGLSGQKSFAVSSPGTAYFNDLSQQAAGKQLQMLPAVWTSGAGAFLTHDAITSAGQVKGMKLRTIGPEINDIVTALGASPISMSSTDVTSALTTGAVNGAFGTTGVFNGAWKGLGKTEVSLDDYLQSNYVFLMSSSRWVGLSAADQQLLESTLTTVGKKFAAAANSLETSGESQFAATPGQNVIKLSGQYLTAVNQGVTPLYNSYKSQFPSIFQAFTAAAEAQGLTPLVK